MSNGNQTEFIFTAKDDVTPVVNGLITALGRLQTQLPQTDKSLQSFEKTLASSATKAGLLGNALNSEAARMQQYRNTLDQLTAAGVRYNKAGRLIGPGGKFVSSETAAEYREASTALRAYTTAQETSNRAADAALAKNAATLQTLRAKNEHTQKAAMYQKMFGAETLSATEKASRFAAIMENVPPNSVRYALYDVSNALFFTGAAFAATGVAAVAFAASYERAFADVERTVNDLDAAGLENLNRQLLEMAGTIPVSYQELARIASLAGQLGIQGEGVDEFTESVAKIATVSDLTVDKAATAFGRFKAILGVPEKEFENLASSILAVGVNSVATESQIVNITTQIASMAGFAGFTADQVIGLSGALASIGAPPELSRGVVTRAFALMSEAVAEGGHRLDRFAELAGVSGEEFAAAWGTERFAGTFQAFMRGIAEEGGDAVSTLHDLGITSVRDVPLLMRLAGAADSTGKEFGLLAQTMRDAEVGYRQNTELNRQYEKIAATLVEQLKVLGNNFANLGAIIGSTLLPIVKPLVNGLNQIVSALGAMAADPVGGAFLSIITVVVTLTGAILLLGSALARGVASMIAMQTATGGLVGSFTATRAQIAGMNAQLALTPGFMARTGVAARGLGAALSAALGPIGLATAAITTLIALAPAISDWRDAMSGISFDFDPSFERLLKDGRGGIATLKDMGKELVALNRSVPYSELFRNLQSVDEGIAQLAKSGNPELAAKRYQELKRAAVDAGVDMDEFRAAMVDSTAAFAELAPEAKNADVAIQDFADGTSESVQELERLAEALAGAFSSFVDNGSLIQENQRVQIEAAKAHTESLAQLAESRGDNEEAAALRAGDAWTQFYDGMTLNFDAYMEQLRKQVEAQTLWADNMVLLAQRGVSQGILGELAKLGPEGAPLVAALATSTDAELQEWITLMETSGSEGGAQFGAGILAQTAAVTNAMSVLGGDVRDKFLEEVNAGRQPFEEILRNYGLDAQGNPIPLVADDADLYNKAASYQQWLNRQTYYLNVTARVTGMQGATNSSGQLSGPGFAHGGYTGAGGKYQPAGIVHAGEFVFPQEAVRRIGLSSLYAMMKGSARGVAPSRNGGYANGGMVTAGGFSSLDAASLQAIMRLADRPIILMTESRIIAEAASEGSLVLAQNGKG